MLEGKELEGDIGNGYGHYTGDVDAKGNITFEATLAKDFGYTKFSSANKIETNIFKLAEEIAKKTATPWDDKAIAGIKKLLGIE